LEQHIASVFDRDLEAIQAHIMKMGGLVEQSIRDSALALKRRDTDLADRVRDNDVKIDELETLIHEEATRVIALRAPAASDLRLIMSVLRISVNLERIGDYSKNMSRRTGVVLNLPEMDGVPETVVRMAGEVEKMLKDCLDAYVRRDEAMARDVIERDLNVDRMYNGLFRQLVTFMLENPRNITACMHLHFMIKNIERMGDHVTSIAEMVVFIVTGVKPSSRPMGADPHFLDLE
jgi:phosphate transport system protein